MMTTFLNQVRQATAAMGKAPYDDEKTREYVAEISRKTSEHCDMLSAKKHQMEMGKLEETIKELEQNSPPMGKYGREALRYIQALDKDRYLHLLMFENLFERILIREEQAQTRLRTIIDQQEKLEKTEDIEDFLEKVAVRRRIKLEADSLVMREIVLRPM